MKLEELAQLKVRAIQALSKGFEIAYIESYIAELGGGAPPSHVAPNSVEHLLCLIEQAEKGEVKPAKEPKPAKVEAPKAEPVKAEEPAPKVEEPPATGPAPVVEPAPAPAPKKKKGK